MREADRAECEALGFSPIDALVKSLAVSREAYAMLFDGEPAAVFGVVPMPKVTLVGAERGRVWALTGRGVDKHKKAFIRWSRRVVTQLLERYELLFNFVDARYVGALRWLASLGFDVFLPEQYGAHGALFCPFRIRRQ